MNGRFSSHGQTQIYDIPVESFFESFFVKSSKKIPWQEDIYDVTILIYR